MAAQSAAQFATLTLLVISAWAAQPRPQQQQQSEGVFLQHASSRSRSAQPDLFSGGTVTENLPATGATPFPPDFFSGDSQKMAEMPPYDNVQVAPATKPGAPQKWEPDELCAPVCKWSCGPKAECNQAEVCEPQCLPPSCKTICKKTPGLCQTRCNKPQCAVVCPDQGCPSHNCPRCGTVCSQPNCTTMCGDDCHSVCEKPQCQWKCHAVACGAKPTCVLKCDGDTKCPQVKSDVVWAPTAPPGSDVASVGEASLDPKDLVKKVTAPPPWTLQVTTPRYKEDPVRIKRQRDSKWPFQEIIKPLLPSSVDDRLQRLQEKPASPRDDDPPPLPGGRRPVRDLKRRWAIQDAQHANQRRND